MNTLEIELRTITAQRVIVSADALWVDLTDGRTVSVPLAWYPRLVHGTAKERNKWRLIGEGEGIHWPDLDEDISVESIVLGKHSGESQRSLKKWLERRATQRHKVARERASSQARASRQQQARGLSASSRRRGTNSLA
ncbi:MAG: DUF2442 domain-containing protein [Chloroflexi bacterium]|nr:DUF2442 domain-containing protein [Chloroflexota bacterium]